MPDQSGIRGLFCCYSTADSPKPVSAQGPDDCRDKVRNPQSAFRLILFLSFAALSHAVFYPAAGPTGISTGCAAGP